MAERPKTVKPPDYYEAKTAAAHDAWYCHFEGETKGPMTGQDLRWLLSEKAFPPDTPVWTAHFGDAWRSATDAGLTNQKSLHPARPLVWERLIAFCPVVGLILILGLLSSGWFNENLVVSLSPWVVGLVLMWLGYKDSQAVTQAGLNPNNTRWWGYMLLSPIGYFLRRRAVTGLPLGPMWLWLTFTICLVGLSYLG